MVPVRSEIEDYLSKPKRIFHKVPRRLRVALATQVMMNKSLGNKDLHSADLMPGPMEPWNPCGDPFGID